MIKLRDQILYLHLLDSRGREPEIDINFAVHVSMTGAVSMMKVIGSLSVNSFRYQPYNRLGHVFENPVFLCV